MSFRRGRGRRRGGFRRARNFVRRTVARMGRIEGKRVLLNAVSVPAKTTNPWDNMLTVDLVVAQETVDEELETDGTNVAQIYPGATVVSARGIIKFLGTNVGTTTVIRWMIYKKPDGEALVTDLTDTFFHNTNDSPTGREIRANVIAKGMVVGRSDAGVGIKLWMSKKALRRLGRLRENDKISLLIATNEASAATIHGFGTIYVRQGHS